MFDVSGRRIPPSAIAGPVNPACDRYGLAQPAIDHSVIHRRISEHIPGVGALTADEFATRAAAILENLRRGEATRELASGTHVPFMLPQGPIGDLSQALEDVYLPAVGASWKARYPKYDFKNELRGGLASRLTVAAGSRYETMMQAMERGPVVGIYFPLALSGYSVDAALSQMSELPSGAVLSGPIDVAAALIGVPELIMKEEGYAPQLDLSAIEGPAARYAYHFAPYGYNLTFNGRYHNGLASDYCSSGLTWISPKF
jgi:hypothetical protein